MVAGLEEAAKRAEALAAREAAKRKSGGKMSANVALHVDDTGSKWSMRVRLGIAAAVLLVGSACGFMYYKATHSSIDPRVALNETRQSLADYASDAKMMPQFTPGESITAQAAKDRIQKNMESQLESVKKTIAADAASSRTPDKSLLQRRERLEKRLHFKDGWGTPFDFSVEGEDLLIRSVSKYEGLSNDPVKVRVRGAAGEKSADALEKKDK